MCLTRTGVWRKYPASVLNQFVSDGISSHGSSLSERCTVCRIPLCNCNFQVVNFLWFCLWVCQPMGLFFLPVCALICLGHMVALVFRWPYQVSDVLRKLADSGSCLWPGISLRLSVSVSVCLCLKQKTNKQKQKEEESNRRRKRERERREETGKGFKKEKKKKAS